MINIGDTYGIYTVLEDTGQLAKDGHRIYCVRCNVCNRIFYKTSNNFAYGKWIVTKCQHDKIGANRIKNKRIRKIFRAMHKRCYNPNDKNYHVYGGRGIYICDKWLNDPKKFEKWSIKNGYTDILTIDRIDGNGPYAPWNCRWVTKEFNCKFRRITNVITVGDITDSGKGWSTRLNLPVNKINKINLKYGNKFTTRYVRDKLNGFDVLLPKKKKKN